MDPQAHASLATGVDPDELSENLYEVLAEPGDGHRLEQVLINVSEGIDLAPSSIVLSALEQKLSGERQDTRTQRLANALETLSTPYDYVLIDCPPAVSLLTFNALRASQEVIIPLETSFFAIDGVQKLLETIALLSDRIGHDLSVRVLPTLYDGRTRYARQTLGDIRELFKDLCFDSVIRLNVKLREAARSGVPINLYARRANGTLDYAAVALELAACPPDSALDIGAQASEPVSREVVIHFSDSGAGEVRIAGDFNGWIPDKDVRSVIESEGPTRVWTKVLRLSPGTYQYRYIVDGEWRVDPANPESTPGPSGQPNSVLHVP
jgi:chromosome partitioning protein